MNVLCSYCIQSDYGICYYPRRTDLCCHCTTFNVCISRDISTNAEYFKLLFSTGNLAMKNTVLDIHYQKHGKGDLPQQF